VAFVAVTTSFAFARKTCLPRCVGGLDADRVWASAPVGVVFATSRSGGIARG